MKIDFSKVQTYPLADRKSKVTVEDFAKTLPRSANVSRFLASLPKILAAQDFQAVIAACRRAHRAKKPILWAIGGHVIKCGLSPLLIDLMKRGFVQHLAMNGACLIHDFEIAYIGSTSEDVEASLGSGAFGMAWETGEFINQAINRNVMSGFGLAAAVGKSLVEGLDSSTAKRKSKATFHKPKFLNYSLLAAAYRSKIPVTAHLAVGTDIIHNHPAANGRFMGEGAMRDYRTFAASVASLHGGGMFLNFGSAVIMPEVFLKAVTLTRNLGHPLKNFTTANFDFIQHYRGIQNIVKRPTQDGQGRDIPSPDITKSCFLCWPRPWWPGLNSMERAEKVLENPKPHA